MVRPITGMLRRQFFTDISVALGIGTAAGYAYWYGFHLPRAMAHDQGMARLEKEAADKQAALLRGD